MADGTSKELYENGGRDLTVEGWKCFLASLLGEVNPDPEDEDGSDSRDEE